MIVQKGVYLGFLACLYRALLVAAQTVTVSNPQVENKVAPIGIDVNPRFSWNVDSGIRGATQYYYGLSLSKVAPGSADVWSSGYVLSKKTYGIEYAGSALLASDTRYFWSLTTYSSNFNIYSSTSSNFTTGFLSASDWNPSVWVGKPVICQSIPDALSASFRAASWIWTSESDPPNAPPEDRAFRKTFTTPNGKAAISALILITVDDQFSLYVNGNLVGSSPTTPDIWKSSQKFIVPLSRSSNLFAVRGSNVGGPAGLLAVIQITYSDGTTTIISSDASWRSTKTIPENFEFPSINDSSWSPATVLAPYGSGPWENNVQSPCGDISLNDATWIWSSELALPIAPAQPRAFRKTFQTPDGKTLKAAFILLTVDDGFDLYVNGILIGSSPSQPDIWRAAQRYTVPLTASSSTSFAVKATNLPDGSNGPTPAGLLATIQIVYTDETSTLLFSDSTWKVNKEVRAGFELPSTDDSTWSSATAIGNFGVGPWGKGVSSSHPLSENPAPLLRKEFNVTKAISFARLYYAAGGYASITLNGAPASNLVLTPGFTKYDAQTQYVVVDVTSRLKVGNNAIGVELGRSHYSVAQRNAWNWDRAPWNAEPAFRSVLSIGYTDGTTARVVSDTTWQYINGPTRLDDVFGGENFDANFLKPGFDTAGYVALGWANVQAIAGPKGALVNQRQHPTRVVQSMRPVSISQPVKGIYVAEFERVASGWAKITVTGPAKTLITIRYGEKLKEDRTIVYEDDSHSYATNFQTDRFWLAGTGGPEIFEPKFSYKGYQYIQLEGWPGKSPPTAANIVGQVVRDDIPTRGGFESSSSLLNDMHQAAVNTMLNNVHSIPEDCPTSGKNGWSGDAMLSAEMFLANLGAEELLAKYARDLAESRPNGSGAPALIAPDSNWGANIQAPPLHSAFILIPWWLYQYRGDRRVLEDHYSGMKSYIAFELSRSPNNIASTKIGDWMSPETNITGGNAPEDGRLTATAYLYKMLTTMNQIAVALGKSADATTFSNQASGVKTAFNNAFLGRSGYSGVGDSGYRQTHNLLALAFDLAPNATSAQTVADGVSRDVVTRGNHLNTGALGTKYILPVLAQYNHADTAMAVALQTTFPSWGLWIDNDASTTWEHWALESRSRSHLSLATYEDWLYKQVAGIQLNSSAFETVIIAPAHTAQLSSARAWTITPFGNLTVDWANNSERFRIDVGIPGGVEATVTIPAPNAASVLESGKSLATQGIKVLGSDNGSVRVVAPSGKYSFIVYK